MNDISLICNSGIQFYELEEKLIIDTSANEGILESLYFYVYEENGKIKLAVAYSFSGSKQCLRRSHLEAAGCLHPVSDQSMDEDDINEAMNWHDPQNLIPINKLTEKVGELGKSGLEQIENIWLRIPYFESNLDGGSHAPTKWCRMKLNRIASESTEERRVYKVLLAFDTDARRRQDKEAPYFLGEGPSRWPSIVRKGKEALSKTLPRLKWAKKLWVVLCLCVFASLCVWAYKAFTKSTESHSLNQEEISQIIRHKQDSLTIEIFDGFYLVPAKKVGWQGDSETNEAIDSSDKGPTTQEEVIADYLNSLNGKYNVVNANGEILSLPDAVNGIDSLCLKNAPFVEYLDNNGLRRVVALFKDDVYYYLGECGSHDGFRQYILANKNGKSGLVDVNGTILKDFFNEKITLASNGYYVKNGGANQFYNFAGSAIEPTPTTSSDNVNSNAALPSLSNFYDSKMKLWGYKNSNGKIVIPAKFKRCPYRFSGTIETVLMPDDTEAFIDRDGNILASFKSIDNAYVSDSAVRLVKVKGANGKYGIHDTNSRRLTVPAIYDDVSIYGYKSNLFPVKKDGKWGYVKAGGCVAIPFKFNEASSFGVDSQLAAVADENGKWGYIDMSGNFKIPAQYYSAGTMSSDGARVRKSSTEYGYITKSGSLVASWYPYIGTKFVLDRIFVRNKDKLGGFLNKQNQLVIPYMFDSNSEPMFDENSHLAKILYNGIEWYINTNGAFCYPASSNLKPSDQNIPAQISIAKEKAEKKQGMPKNKNTNEKIKNHNSTDKQTSSPRW